MDEIYEKKNRLTDITLQYKSNMNLYEKLIYFSETRNFIIRLLRINRK